MRVRWMMVWALLGLPGGCAFVRSDGPSASLRQRILPPAGVQPAGEAAGSLAPEPSRSDPTPEGEAVLPADEAEPDGPLTLDQAVALAYRYSPQLEVMRQRVAQAEGGRQVAFADFLPRAATSYRHIAGEGNVAQFALPTIPTAVGNVAFGGESDEFRLAELHLQWTVWDFGRTPGRYGQAVAAVDIARLQYLRAQQTVAFNVAASYFAVLQAQAARRVAEEAVRRAESYLRDARNYLKRGTAIRNDVLRAEVLLAEMRLNLVKARTADAAAVAGLNQVIGINVSCPTRVVELDREPDFELSLAQSLQLAVDNRREFAVVLRATDSARLGKGIAQADFLPRVYVGGVGAHEEGRGLRKEVNQISGGVHIELGLFEGGRRLGKLASAEAEVRAAIAQGKEVCDRIAYEVTLAYLGIDDARQRIELSRTAVAQGTENLRVVRSLFEKGDATPTDVVDAELAITRAQQGLYTALYDYQTSLARFVYAVGVPPGSVFPGEWE
jgi:outer membrane protein TolC